MINNEGLRTWRLYASGLLSAGINGYWSQKIMDANALMADSATSALLAAAGCSLPSAAIDGALNEMGREIRMLRAPNEPKLDYSNRLIEKEKWVDLFGTAPGLRFALRALGCESVTIHQRPGSDDFIRCAYSIVIRQPHPFGTTFDTIYVENDVDTDARMAYYDDGYAWDSNMPDNLSDILFNICAQNRGAHANPRSIVIIFSGDVDDQLEPIDDAEVLEIGIDFLIDRGG